MSKIIIGVMGPGKGATKIDLELAYTIGALIAQESWALLTGGRNVGVMDAASKGAQEAGGITIGILPDQDKNRMSTFVDIPVVTGMGSARNNINVLSSDVVIAIGLGAGTMSEIMLAIKCDKPIMLLNQTEKTISFLKTLDYSKVEFPDEPQQLISRIRKLT